MDPWWSDDDGLLVNVGNNAKVIEENDNSIIQHVFGKNDKHIYYFTLTTISCYINHKILYFFTWKQVHDKITTTSLR